MVAEGEWLWSPTEDANRETNLARYTAWLNDTHGLTFADYAALWQWSVRDLSAFWASIWDYHQIMSDTRFTQVLSGNDMPGAQWFAGAHVNYAEHLLRHEAASGQRTVFHHLSETRPLSRMVWPELGRQVRILATQLRAMGIQPGDRIVSYMPNVPETAIAMMAAIAIGAVWASAAPEFGPSTVIDRFAQIEPAMLFACDGYQFGGKAFSRLTELRAIIDGLPSLRYVVYLPYLNPASDGTDIPLSQLWSDIMAQPDVAPKDFHFTRVPHDHPLWIVFSSGTTGLPKAIVHSHVGALLEHVKLIHLHFDFNASSVMFFYTTTGWMMWNLLLSALLAGAAVVLYDGSPTNRSVDFLWRLAADTGTTSFGASPTFVHMMQKAGLQPGALFDLSSLQQVIVAGAPSTPEIFEWFYRNVKADLWVTSQSGGTELCSGFVGAAPGLPVYAGEIQTRMLGMDVHAWNDDGVALIDQVGELVVTSPCPSMPLYFWNDPQGRRYRESYFDVFPGVWRHGDFIKINRRGGCYIYGRSDSTLNRHGVRIGTAEIYRAVDRLEDVADSLAVCCELPGGRFFMPLFLQLRPGLILDQALQQQVAAILKNTCSPRHVPDSMYQVQAVPYTLTGKKMEVPVRKILMGWKVENAASRDAMLNPDSLDYFVKFAQDSTDYDWRAAPPNPSFQQA